MTTNSWVPAACTLPTAERPLRAAEFDALFATALRAQQRVSATALRWHLDPSAEIEARSLAARESECCSFFTFTFHRLADLLQVDVEVPLGQTAILDALCRRGALRITP